MGGGAFGSVVGEESVDVVFDIVAEQTEGGGGRVCVWN